METLSDRERAIGNVRPAREEGMQPKNYSRLAAVIFAVIAVLQLVRVLLAWDIMLNGAPIPLFVSGMAAFVAAIMAWLGFRASR
jgi:hypothetical protein